MQRTRPIPIATALVLLLGASTPGLAAAAKPAPSTPSDITSSVRGQELAAETAERFKSYGVPTDASDLEVLQNSNGSIVVAPELLISLSSHATSDGAIVTADVGSQVTSTQVSTESSQQVQAAAAAYWTLRESGCLSSLYVDSARLDSCYYIYQLINDGSTTRNYWALRQKGTAFEYGGGLHWARVTGERTPNTAAQTWVDWAPEQEHTGSCSTVNVGVSYIVSLGYSVTACEHWIFDKSCNGCAPWISNKWDCNCLFGLDAKNGTVSRAIAYQMIVSTTQTATPRFRLGLSMGA